MIYTVTVIKNGRLSKMEHYRTFANAYESVGYHMRKLRLQYDKDDELGDNDDEYEDMAESEYGVMQFDNGDVLLILDSGIIND